MLLGPPGTGKGSLASLCKGRLHLAHLSPGQIFREEIARKSGLGRRVQRYVSSGRLVPDSLVVQVMTSRLTRRTLDRGFVLDGFPRTQGQAAGLDRVLEERHRPLEAAIYLASPQAVLIRRLAGRRVCAKCGANYHLRTMRPKQPGRCDQCRGPLVIRKDDRPATMRKRLAVDQIASKPLLAHYKHCGVLYRVNGSGYIETVYQRLLQLLRKQGWLE